MVGKGFFKIFLIVTLYEILPLILKLTILKSKIYEKKNLFIYQSFKK